jgi:hypothetical protein
VDEDGLVLDAGLERTRLWVGRHHREVPGPLTILAGVAPRLALGLGAEEAERCRGRGEQGGRNL